MDWINSLLSFFALNCDRMALVEILDWKVECYDK